MTSPRKAEANRANALKSTGPRTADGKHASSRNSLKHGLTAKVVAVVPGEDPQEFQERLDDWLAVADDDDAVGRALARRAAVATWRLDRSVRRETAVLSEKARHAATEHDARRRNEVEALGQRLIYEPINRVSECQWRDPIIAERLERRADDDPPVLFRQLCATAEGVDWLRARWVELHVALHRDGFWHYPEKFKAMRLLGKRPEDLLEDAAVAEIMAVCFYMHPCGDPRHETHWDFQEEAERGKMGVTGKPMYEVQVEALTDLIPKTRQDAYDRLFKLYETEVDRLDALKADLLDAVAEADRAEAVDRALFDDSPSGVLQRRYEAQCERELHRCIAGLAKHKVDADRPPTPEPEPEPEPEPQPEPEPEPLPQPEPEPGPEPGPVEPAPAPEHAPRNEAKPGPSTDPDREGRRTRRGRKSDRKAPRRR